MFSLPEEAALRGSEHGVLVEKGAAAGVRGVGRPNRGQVRVVGEVDLDRVDRREGISRTFRADTISLADFRHTSVAPKMAWEGATAAAAAKRKIWSFMLSSRGASCAAFRFCILLRAPSKVSGSYICPRKLLCFLLCPTERLLF